MINKISAILLVTIIIINIPLKEINAQDNTIKNDNNEVYIRQLEEKSKLLIEAIDKFGATSKDEVVKIYSEGIKNRSGAMQYSVMCKKLKKQFIKTMDKEQNYSWVTGYSSPWVKDYKVIYDKENMDQSYTVTIKFSWETSSGPFNNTVTNLTIEKVDQHWCIVCIENENR